MISYIIHIKQWTQNMFIEGICVHIYCSITSLLILDSRVSRSLFSNLTNPLNMVGIKQFEYLHTTMKTEEAR